MRHVSWIAVGLGMVILGCFVLSYERPAQKDLARPMTGPSPSVGESANVGALWAIEQPPEVREVAPHGVRTQAPKLEDAVQLESVAIPPSALELEVDAVEAAMRIGPVNLDAVGEFGDTLLGRVACAGRVDLARRLIAIGASPSAPDMFAYTPLDLLERGCGTNSVEVYEYLRSAGGTWIVFR